jgi:DNA-binding transcriptional regulator LsrR (DeoR family)
MTPVPRKNGIQVVQILGGLGNASSQNQSAYLASHLASLVNGTAYFLPLPAVIKTDEVYQTIIQDKSVSDVLSLFPFVNTALVGIGALNPSSLLAASGNALSEKDIRILESNGAVGDILLRFFDQNGNEMDQSLLTSHVISMEIAQLKKVERAIGIAGGRRKYRAIRGSLRGRLINILITDQFTAQRLLEE